MTNLSRRRFFGLIGGAAAVHFLPPISGWKSDVITSPFGIIPGERLFLIGHSEGMLWWSKDKYEDFVSFKEKFNEIAYDPFIVPEGLRVRLNYKLKNLKA